MAAPVKAKPKGKGKVAAHAGGVMGALTRKFGPLPAWAWLILAGGGIYLYNKRAATGQATQPATNDVSSPNTGDYGYGSGGGDSGGGGGGTPTYSTATPTPSTIIQGIKTPVSTAQKQTTAAQKKVIAAGGGAFVRTGKQAVPAGTATLNKNLSSALAAGTARKTASHAATAKPITTTGKGRLPAGIKIPTKVSGKFTTHRVVKATKKK